MLRPARRAGSPSGYARRADAVRQEPRAGPGADRGGGGGRCPLRDGVAEGRLMAKDILMPQMGYDMTEGTVVRWVKKIGDRVHRGDIVAEIETDKATVEIEAL